MKWTIPLILVGLVHEARADQCEANESAIREAAIADLRSHDTFIRFCEMCGETVPNEPEKVASIEIAGDTILLNGKSTDLAYTYIRISKTQYQNLGMRAGCAPTGVSPSLRVTDSPPNGEMIYASNDAVDRAPVVIVEQVTAEPAAPAPAPQVVMPPPSVVVIDKHESSLGWLPVAGGAVGASAIWAAWALTVARRRRSTMIPRAIQLRAPSDRV